MTILVETTAPERGHLSLRIHADFEIKVSAEEAQQRVTQFVHRNLSSQMHGGTPTLLLSERAYWQVPVHLTFPAVGDAGSVGKICVDVETGALDTTKETLEEIETNAEELARRFAFAPAR